MPPRSVLSQRKTFRSEPASERFLVGGAEKSRTLYLPSRMCLSIEFRERDSGVKSSTSTSSLVGKYSSMVWPHKSERSRNRPATARRASSCIMAPKLGEPGQLFQSMLKVEVNRTTL